MRKCHGEPAAKEEGSTRRCDGVDPKTQRSDTIFFSTSLSSLPAALLLPTRSAPSQLQWWSTNGRKGGGRRRHRVQGGSG
jgi:hypothetical protein